jgi:hypothetical protein
MLQSTASRFRNRARMRPLHRSRQAARPAAPPPPASGAEYDTVADRFTDDALRGATERVAVIPILNTISLGLISAYMEQVSASCCLLLGASCYCRSARWHCCLHGRPAGTDRLLVRFCFAVMPARHLPSTTVTWCPGCITGRVWLKAALSFPDMKLSLGRSGRSSHSSC